MTGNMPEDHPTEIAGIPLVAAGDYVVEYLCREWVDEVFVNLPLQSAQLDDLVRQLNEMGITVHIQLADKLMVGTQRQFVERLGGIHRVNHKHQYDFHRRTVCKTSV